MKIKVIVDYEYKIRKPIERHKKLEMQKWGTRHDYENILAMTSMPPVNGEEKNDDKGVITPNGDIIDASNIDIISANFVKASILDIMKDPEVEERQVMKKGMFKYEQKI